MYKYIPSKRLDKTTLKRPFFCNKLTLSLDLQPQCLLFNVQLLCAAVTISGLFFIKTTF